MKRAIPAGIENGLTGVKIGTSNTRSRFLVRVFENGRLSAGNEHEPMRGERMKKQITAECNVNQKKELVVRIGP